MDGRSLDAALMLAHALMSAGKFEAARDLLLGVVDARPEDDRALRILVHARLRLGEYAEAESFAKDLGGSLAGIRQDLCALFPCSRFVGEWKSG